MARKFPKFESHHLATCFNCEADLDGSHYSESGYPKGGFKQDCPKCGMLTFYDLRKAAA
jgi:hypothetical protein